MRTLIVMSIPSLFLVLLWLYSCLCVHVYAYIKETKMFPISFLSRCIDFISQYLSIVNFNIIVFRLWKGVNITQGLYFLFRRRGIFGCMQDSCTTLGGIMTLLFSWFGYEISLKEMWIDAILIRSELVIVNFMCHTDQAVRCPDIGLNVMFLWGCF